MNIPLKKSPRVMPKYAYIMAFPGSGVNESTFKAFIISGENVMSIAITYHTGTAIKIIPKYLIKIKWDFEVNNLVEEIKLR